MTPQIGTDIEENSRFDRLLIKDSFLQGVYAPEEREYIRSAHKPSLAACGLFCAKEAAAKALGDGLFGLRPKDIVIRHNGQGRPLVELEGQARAKYPNARFSLSISHTKEYSTASCLVFFE